MTWELKSQIIVSFLFDTNFIIY